jgi:hypothetical protein
MPRKHAGFTLNREGEGKVARKPYERLSGHGSSPIGEESEALSRDAFDSLGQKRRAFEPLCLSYSNGFLIIQPSLRLYKNQNVFFLLIS